MTRWFEFRDQHPAAAGHFSGDPIAPAAVILCEVFDAARMVTGGMTVLSIERAKFIAPLRPGERCAIDFSGLIDGRLEFICRVEGQTVAHGVLQLTSSDEAKPA